MLSCSTGRFSPHVLERFVRSTLAAMDIRSYCSMRKRLLLVLLFLLQTSFGIYDADRKIEHARLYGNVDNYAYYYVDLVVGTPPQRVSVILDTGSGLCAYPCANCRHCGHHLDPAFDVAKSSSARWLQCSSGRCPVGRCQSGNCSYYQGYTEGSSISGFWFEDKVSLGDMIQHNPQVSARMGCHANENNLFFTQKANGIMGIGPSALSGEDILDKIFKDRDHVSHKVFSICMAEWGGQFTVGGFDESFHTGPVQRVRLKPGGFYSVHLSAMKVNGVSISSNWGSTMIDSGTTYTYMRSSNYRALTSAIETYCRGHQCGGTKYGTKCWSLPHGPDQFPHIAVVFDGVETKWVPRAYFYRRGTSDTYCYGFEDDGPHANTVLGAAWMKRQNIIFDMEKNEVGIATANCPHHKDRPAHVAQASSSPSSTTTSMAATSVTTSTLPTTASSTHASTARAIETTAPSTTAPTSEQGAIPARFLGQDPLPFVGGMALGILVGLCLFLIRKVCFKVPELHGHVKLKEDEESEMPPQIVTD